MKSICMNMNTDENNEILNKDFIFTYLSAMENNSCITNYEVNMHEHGCNKLRKKCNENKRQMHNELEKRRHEETILNANNVFSSNFINLRIKFNHILIRISNMNPSKAFFYTQKSADLSDAEGLYKLGRYYLQGQGFGIEKYLEKSLTLFKNSDRTR
ncbi:42839_t:CDS:2 [Gigaspora margarita]|uniref:42839_t:CDS:1 n=1 Tax=Gigaspora margarita TaxID=4874 RepID=A0ABM8W1F4_GIGMA|nr:42839_t:CDS:2 [Gigaspora margarita]